MSANEFSKSIKENIVFYSSNMLIIIANINANNV